MPGDRRHALLTLFAALVATAGCCERKGYVLRGDIAIELNRVSHLIGRHDDYESCPGDCDCAECVAMDAWGGDGGAILGSGDARLHPVPTRPVFAPSRPTPAASREPTNAPAASRRARGDQRARVAQAGQASPRAASPQRR